MSTTALAKRPVKRNKLGRFQPGTAAGPGNPNARRTALLKSTLVNAVSEEDLRAVVRALVKRAKRGDIQAAKLLFDRLLGKPGVLTETEPEQEDETSFCMSDVIRGLHKNKAQEAGTQSRSSRLSPG